LALKGEDGLAYGRDFVKDPKITIKAPRIVRGNAQKEIIPTDYVAQLVTDDVMIVSGSKPFNYNQAKDGTFDDDPLIPGNARTKFNPSARIAYNDSNTHTGHSGAPILNEAGEIVAVHNAAEADPDGNYKLGPGLAVGSYLDARTNDIINKMVASDIKAHNPSCPDIDVASWRNERSGNNLTSAALQTPQQNSPGRRPG
jgi:hypothetical protein